MSTLYTSLDKSVRQHLWGAGVFLGMLLIFVTAAASYAQISGAVIAPGFVVVESNLQTIKHKEGGIVSEVLVKDGDLVQSGDLLLRLDASVTLANLAVVNKKLDQLLGKEARLVAERDDSQSISFPPQLTDRYYLPDINRILVSENQLMEARRAGVFGRTGQLREQVNQLKRQIESLDIQSVAKAEEIELIATELASLEQLLEKNYVSANRVLVVKRTYTRLKAERGALGTEMAKAELAISERQVQILQIEEDVQAKVIQELQETRNEIAVLLEQRVGAEDLLSRIDIRAPRTGYVHQLKVNTKGAYVSPAEPMMFIVPKGDKLVVDAMVAPTDIDQIFVGQASVVRLPGLNRRTTPGAEWRDCQHLCRHVAG